MKRAKDIPETWYVLEAGVTSIEFAFLSIPTAAVIFHTAGSVDTAVKISLKQVIAVF